MWRLERGRRMPYPLAGSGQGGFIGRFTAHTLPIFYILISVAFYKISFFRGRYIKKANLKSKIFSPGVKNFTITTRTKK